MLSALIAGGLITAVAGLVGAGVSSYVNYRNTVKTNEANREINERNLEYNTAMTQAQWERDDTAHQREVADLKAAGLSPLANTSGSQVSAALGAPNPIAMQAPQLDTNALIQSVLGAQKNIEEYRHNKNIERQRDTELDLQAQELAQRAEQLDIENKRVEAQICYQTKLNELEARRLAEIERSNKKDEALTLSAQESLELERESKRYAEEVQRQVGDIKLPYQPVYDVNTYFTYKKLRQVALDNFIKKLEETRHTTGSSKSGSGSVGVSNAFVTGLNPNVSASGSASEYESKDISQKQEIMWRKFNEEHPVPVYIDKSQYKYFFK